jgi:hypothetical protein
MGATLRYPSTNGELFPIERRHCSTGESLFRGGEGRHGWGWEGRGLCLPRLALTVWLSLSQMATDVNATSNA